MTNYKIVSHSIHRLRHYTLDTAYPMSDKYGRPVTGVLSDLLCEISILLENRSCW